MPKNFERNPQKVAKESCIKVPSRKKTRLEHAGHNIFESLTNSVNQNSPEFVMFNKKETFKKLNRKVLDKLDDFGNQGYSFYLVPLILNIICCYYLKKS